MTAPDVLIDDTVVDDHDVSHHTEDDDPGTRVGEEVVFDLGPDGEGSA